MAKQLLSPAANAAWEAFNDVLERVGVFEDYGDALAAALRAAADQVVPEDMRECETYTNEAIRLNLQGVRRQLLAIAAELETTTTDNP